MNDKIDTHYSESRNIVTQLEDQWFKILSIVLYKFRDVIPREGFTITVSDILEFRNACPDHTIIAHGKQDDTIYIKLATTKEAEEYMRENSKTKRFRS